MAPDRAYLLIGDIILGQSDWCSTTASGVSILCHLVFAMVQVEMESVVVIVFVVA